MKGSGSSLFSRETLLDEKNEYGDRFKALKRFYLLTLSLQFSYVLKDGLKPQTPQRIKSKFKALLEASYCQDTFLFMDNLRS